MGVAGEGRAMSSSTRWLLGVLIGVGVIAAVGVAVALGTRAPSYPSDSAEYAVQQYIAAVANRDATKAIGYLSPEVVTRCESIPREAITNRGRSSLRATLLDVTARDRMTVVRVRITESYGDAPFDGGESNMEQSFELTRGSDGWRFVESPWPLYCPPKPVR
jgi:hypothetical protein